MKTTSLLSAAAYATVALAVGPAVPENAERLPGKPALMENWSWPNPFPSDPNNPRITISSESEASSPTRFLATCSSQRTFKATEYLLDDLQELPPQGLIPWVEALRKVFTNRQYPGSWDGIDPHGYDRNMLMMEYADVPTKVKEWIENEEWTEDGKAKGLFAVLAKADVDKGEKIVSTATSSRKKKPATKEEEQEWRAGDKNRVVIFAPGAVYENAPLWVAEGSDCEDTLSDITKYTAKPAEGAVVAYPVHKTQADRAEGKRDMEFTIKAQVLKVDDTVADDEEVVEGVKAKVEKKVEDVKAKAEEVKEKVEEKVKDEL